VGAWLGIATAFACALAFNYFHIPPTGRFTIADGENWVALVVFLITAIVASALATIARSRTLEAEQRRREADLAAEMARTLLRGQDQTERLVDGLAVVPRRRLDYRGTTLEEMDLPAVLRSRPELCLIDELAQRTLPARQALRGHRRRAGRRRQRRSTSSTSRASTMPSASSPASASARPSPTACSPMPTRSCSST